jgi:hypothetical protein
MRKFIGREGYQTPPDVPARDLTEEEWSLYTQPLYRRDGAGEIEKDAEGNPISRRTPLIVEGDPSAAFWEKAPDPKPERTPPTPPAQDAEKEG